MNLRRVSRALDSWHFWALVSWLALAALVVWLIVLNGRLNTNIERTRKTSLANRDAIAFLCNTNAMLEALTAQATVLLQTEQLTHPEQAREVTIEVFRGYDRELSNARACVRFEKTALR